MYAIFLFFNIILIQKSYNVIVIIYSQSSIKFEKIAQAVFILLITRIECVH